MNVAIVGRSHINGLLVEKLSEEGFNPFQFDNMDEVRGFNGEKLNFTLRTSEGEINVGYVIVTGNLFDEGSFEKTGWMGENGAPIVFILDYPVDSPSYYTEAALKNAVKFAKLKKQVFFLSRFVRTAGKQVEDLYKEARNIGVVFIKYNALSVLFDTDTRVYRIEAADEYESIKIETPSVIMADSTETSTRANSISKAFRLRLDQNGLMNNDRSFLFPSLTNREGVYFIDSASCTTRDEILDRTTFTITELKDETTGGSEKAFLTDINDKHAEIDSGKCAFCYTCFRACPHAAMAPDHENSVMKNLKNNCSACGICVSVCPANAIEITGKVQSKAVEEPGTTGTEQKTLKIFCCENSGEIAAQKLRNAAGELFDKIEIASVSCGGEMSMESITTALVHYEKVLVLTCMDDACRHFEGNKRAVRFVKAVKKTLIESGLDEKRVECMQLSLAMPKVLRDQIKEMIGSEGLR